MSPESHRPELLSPYLDGELDAGSREAVEQHLATCVSCRDILRDLKAIVAAAPEFAGSPPGRDLWPGIAAGIDRSREAALPARAVPRLFTLRQLIAASVLLASAAGGLAWFAARGEGAPPSPPLAGPATEAPTTSLAGMTRADSAYGGATAELEQVLVEGRGRLDTATVRVIEQSLIVIDQAIAEARAAIAADPANAYLNGQIAANMRRKLDLLRRAATAIEASAS